MSKPKKQCSVEGCDRPAHGHGLCRKHYDAARNATPERKKQLRQYLLKYQQTPERKEYMRQYDAARNATPEGKEYKRQHHEQYGKTPAYRAASINRRVRSEYPDTPGEITEKRVAELMQITNCPRCKHKFGTKGHKLHIDHIVPLARGGTNYDDNIQALCATCNHVKNKRTEEELNIMLREMLGLDTPK